MSVDLAALVASPHFQRARVAMGKRADSLSGDAWERWMDLVADWLKVVELFGEEHPFSTLCLLHLVREAWGPRFRGLHVRLEVSSDSWWVYESDETLLGLGAGSLDHTNVICCATEAEALERALLAAPPKDGVGS